MRRRKPKVVWLPLTNSESVAGDQKSAWSLASVGITATNTPGVSSCIEVPIVMDGPASGPLQATSSLADIEESGYRLRRIVGKLYCFLGQDAGTVVAEELWGIDAGFIIRRVNPETGGSYAVAADPAPPFSEINPSFIDNTMDPWIWRRSWILSNGPSMAGLTTPTIQLEKDLWHAGGISNFGKQYPGGNLEGPHVDQKTARIVGREERLFLDVSATDLLGASSNTTLVIIYQFRVLASMRTNIGNRRNASR